MSMKTAKQLRDAQKNWLEEIQRRSGDNFTQMTESCNLYAEKTKQRPVGKDTLRHFFYNYKDASKAESRVLSDRMVFMLYKAYGLEPSFAPDMLYRMEDDKADISEYAKLCKQYITDVSMAQGIYRTDVAKSAGISDGDLSRLFNDKLPKGLPLKKLEAIKEKHKVNFPPRLRSHLEAKSEAKSEIPLVGYVSLKSSDQIWLLNEREQRGIPLPDGMDAKRGRAIELRGPTISAFVKDGMVLFYHEPAKGMTENCLDQTCFVELEDGTTCIKLIERSNRDGFYRLHSLIDGAIEESKIKRAAKIELIRQ
jgi:hypothetical protein